MPDLKIKKCSVILIETKAANTHGNSGRKCELPPGKMEWAGSGQQSSAAAVRLQNYVSASVLLSICFSRICTG